MPKHNYTNTNPLQELERCLHHARGVAGTLSTHNELEECQQFAFGAIAYLLDDAYTELTNHYKQQRERDASDAKGAL